MSDASATEDLQRLRFRGGAAGALAPFLLFVAGVAALAIAGAPDERGFWPVLLAALALGLGLARDRARYAETALRGMSQPIVLLMVMAWLLAGVLATLMNASGFVGSLVWLCRQAGLEGGLFAAAAFLICCLVSTSTGTSLGTVILCAPLLYPAGAPLGTVPAVLMGAVLGGATFGDNVSPISDTTIASATTQGAEIGPVVRSRLRYALPAAAAALLLYAVFGGGAAPQTSETVAVTERLAAAAAGPGEPEPARALPMLAVPVLVIALLLARRHLLEGLLFGAVAAAALGLALGLLRPAQLLFVDAASFGARGLIVDGVERGLGISVFTLLLMGVVSGVEGSGLFESLLRRAEGPIRGRRDAEIAIFGVISAVTILTTHSVVALLAVGPFARRSGERFGLSPERRANLLDVTVCTYPFLLPYCIPTVLAASLSASGVAAGMPRLSPLAVGLNNFHSWGLLAVIVFAVASGWGRSPGR